MNTIFALLNGFNYTVRHSVDGYRVKEVAPNGSYIVWHNQETGFKMTDFIRKPALLNAQLVATGNGNEVEYRYS